MSEVSFNSKLENILEERCQDLKHSQDFPTYPGNRWDYYKDIKTKLYQDYYRDVQAGITRTESNPSDTAFTLHDQSHVNDLIRRIGELLGLNQKAPTDKVPQLSSYEIFVLLVAALIHDTGNYLGRQGHPKKARLILKDVNDKRLSQAEVNLISDIAQAHGGKTTAGSSDTIGDLDKTGGADSITIRQRQIAALLRLADELADNHRRASSLQSTSSLYPNKYCQCVNVIAEPQAGQITLQYAVHTDDLKTKHLNEHSKKQYFLDYIKDRVIKSELERRYCNRYLKEFSLYEKIRVTIKFYDSENEQECFSPIYLELEETGFPNEKEISISCEQFSGIYMAKEVKNRTGSDGS